MSSLGDQITATLTETGPAVALALEFNVQDYFDVLRGLVDEFASKMDVKVVYITASIPASTISSTFKALDVDTENIYFVDCISRLILGRIEEDSKILFVESPTVLENVVLKVEYLTKRMEDQSVMIIVDSINSLAIHNDLKILSEFLHVLISSLNAKEAYPVVLCIGEQTKPEILEVLNLVCDQIVPLQAQQ